MSQQKSNSDVEKNKVVAAISYIWIICLVVLIVKRDSKFALWHAKQGLVLFIIELLIWFIFWIPVVGTLLYLIVIILAALGFAHALMGHWWTMPVVGKMAKKINI